MLVADALKIIAPVVAGLSIFVPAVAGGKTIAAGIGRIAASDLAVAAGASRFGTLGMAAGGAFLGTNCCQADLTLQALPMLRVVVFTT